MILKKLRENRGWSQGHLAEIAGLSIRTIQRIERGNKASLESLMSLASSLEVDISTLKQEIIVIDKTTDNWQSLPFYVKVLFADSNFPVIGPGNRKNYLKLEAIMAVGAVIFLLVGFIMPQLEYIAYTGQLLLIIAYLISVTIRLGDKHDVW